ncbi:flavoprotein [Streptomyces sp. PanSC19]|uniref:flavoprotein n=1 Tax=Streptomyces sp. PanSC19 TaxID=1520455 RepID=UPI000F46EB60|nr:flavoprotein [Streptomyces sp. PanSC19]ROQ32073.1 flavoprotein [Streptomyces sp. PanSC19]
MSTLYLFASAAEPVFDIARVIEDAQADGWDVCLGLTPTAARWLAGSLDGLAVLTGHPVRWDYALPGEPDVWPEASAVLVAPATFTLVNQWALGIADKFVVGVVAEGIGKGIPMVTVPCLSAASARHPQFERSLETLRGAGVSVLRGGEDGFLPDPAEGFPWHLALDAVRERVAVG